MLFSGSFARGMDLVFSLPADDGAPSEEAGQRRLELFLCFLLVHLTAWFLLSGIGLVGRGPISARLFFLMFPVLTAVGLACVLLQGWVRVGAALGLVAQAIFLGLGDPLLAANHVFLAFVMTALFVLLPPDSPENRSLLLTALRWIAVIVFFYTGFQKLLYGTYFNGHFLAARISVNPEFQKAFRPLLSSEAFAFLLSQAPPRPGAGPFRFTDTLPLLLANATWVFEMLIPVAMVVRRTRLWGIGAALGLLFCIEVAAREVLFGVLFALTILLYLPVRAGAGSAWQRFKAEPFGLLTGASALFYAYLVLVRLKVLPGFFFSE